MGQLCSSCHTVTEPSTNPLASGSQKEGGEAFSVDFARYASTSGTAQKVHPVVRATSDDYLMELQSPNASQSSPVPDPEEDIMLIRGTSSGKRAAAGNGNTTRAPVLSTGVSAAAAPPAQDVDSQYYELSLDGGDSVQVERVNAQQPRNTSTQRPAQKKTAPADFSQFQKFVEMADKTSVIAKPQKTEAEKKRTTNNNTARRDPREDEFFERFVKEAVSDAEASSPTRAVGKAPQSDPSTEEFFESVARSASASKAPPAPTQAQNSKLFQDDERPACVQIVSGTGAKQTIVTRGAPPARSLPPGTSTAPVAATSTAAAVQKRPVKKRFIMSATNTQNVPQPPSSSSKAAPLLSSEGRSKHQSTSGFDDKLWDQNVSRNGASADGVSIEVTAPPSVESTDTFSNLAPPD